MSNEATTADNAGAGTSAQTTTEGTDTANADSSKTTTDTPSTDNQDSGDKTFTQADINRIVAKAEKAAVAAALKAKADELADAEKSEAQKARERADEAERKAQDAEAKIASFVIRNAVTMAVSDPGLHARDPKALALLVNPEALTVEGEEVEGIEAELKRIKVAHPALFYSSTADGAAQGDSGGVLDFNAMLRRKARHG